MHQNDAQIWKICWLTQKFVSINARRIKQTMFTLILWQFLRYTHERERFEIGYCFHILTWHYPSKRAKLHKNRCKQKKLQNSWPLIFMPHKRSKSDARVDLIGPYWNHLYDTLFLNNFRDFYKILWTTTG